MASIIKPPLHPVDGDDGQGIPPPLEAGDHLDQKTFHERYEAMGDGLRAELIGGVVYIPSPLKPRHGRMHALVMRWLAEYEEDTPGTEVLDNTTNILGPDSEPQPDGCLLILPEKGGQTRENEDGYLEGAAELMAEIAASTESYDLHSKKTDYEKAGVKEYVVVALRQARVFWFVSRNGRFEELPPGPDGVLRSEVFPGLWLDPNALLRRDRKHLLEVLRQGLATREHTDFVKILASSQRPA
jgi:Uma2 family endonuclease